MTTSPRRKDGFRPDVEGLRGAAVLLVVLFHVGLLSNSAFRVAGGYIGVDLFFVISGFLITGLLVTERERTGRVDFARFYARRVRRILPASILVLLAVMPTAYLLVNLGQRSSVMLDGASAAISIANIRFALTTDYFNPASYSPFLHFWSLGVEEQFYLIWPAVLVLVTWRRPRLGAGLALGLIVAVSFVANVVMTDVAPAWAFNMLPTRAWQLAAGGLLAVVADPARMPRERYRVGLERGLAASGWIAAAALALGALTLDAGTVAYPGVAALLPTLAGVLLVASGPLRSGPGLLFRVPPMRFLGRISYSLYLWHWPVLILGGIILTGPLHQELSPVQAIGLAALSVVVAAISWRFVEEPFRDRRVPMPTRSVQVVVVGAAAMVVVATIGWSFSQRAATVLAAVSQAAPQAPGARSGPPASAGRSMFAVDGATRPSLDQAPTDYERTVADGCLADWGVTAPRPDCVYGDPSSPYTVALLGDSHGSALFPAVEAVANARGWRLVVLLKRGCPFIDMPVYASNLKREYRECAVWNAQVLDQLDANPPDLVLISQLRRIVPVDPADGNDTSKGLAIARQIARIPPGGRVALIEDPPLPDVEIPQCLSVHLDDVRQCAFPREKAFAGVGAKERIAADASGAALVDVSGEVCPGAGDCPAVIDNVIVWRDGTHLTATFARTLGPALDAKLATVLGR